MQTVTKDVMSEKVVVGQVEVPVFDNIDEAIDSLTEDRCLSYINRSHSIALMDARRREATGTGGGTGVRAMMSKLKDNPDLLAQVKALLGEV